MNNFTKDFPCPKCGSTQRFMDNVVAEPERQKGSIPKDLPGALEVKCQAIVNPKVNYLPGTQRPGGMVLFDICVECGTFYCFRIMEMVITLTGPPQNPVHQFPFGRPPNLS